MQDKFSQLAKIFENILNTLHREKYTIYPPFTRETSLSIGMAIGIPTFTLYIDGEIQKNYQNEIVSEYIEKILETLQNESGYQHPHADEEFESGWNDSLLPDENSAWSRNETIEYLINTLTPHDPEE